MNARLQEVFDDLPEQENMLCFALGERLSSVAEQERHKLAEFLHDDALQLGHQTERLLRDTLERFPALPRKVVDLVGEALELTGTLLTRLRGTVQEYYSAPVGLVGLPAALLSLLQGIQKRTDLPYTLDCPSFVGSNLPQEQETLLYTIACEAILNAVKHAHATCLHVSLLRDDDALLLRICDDGKGFIQQPAAELLAGGHIGLLLLQERAQNLQATLHIETAPGQGTILELRKIL